MATISNLGFVRLCVNHPAKQYSEPALCALPSFTFADAAMALRGAAGLLNAAVGDQTKYNVVTTGASGTSVALADAVFIARLVSGLDPNIRG